MPTNTQNFSLYKPDLGQKDPNEWGTGVNTNFDTIDKLLFYRGFLPLWGFGKPSSPSSYDDEFDDNSFNSTLWSLEDGGTGGLVVEEDSFERLKVRKTASAPAVCYVYQQLTSPIDGSTNPTIYFQIAQINHVAIKDLEDTKSEAGLFVGSQADAGQYGFLVWTNVFSNLIRVYENFTNILDTTGKGTEIYNYDYGRIPHVYFFRVRADWDGATLMWNLMFQVSIDGLHWKNLKYVAGALSEIDTFGIILGDNSNDPDSFSSIYHFRYNYSPDSTLYK